MLNPPPPDVGDSKKPSGPKNDRGKIRGSRSDGAVRTGSDDEQLGVSKLSIGKGRDAGIAARYGRVVCIRCYDGYIQECIGTRKSARTGCDVSVQDRNIAVKAVETLS